MKVVLVYNVKSGKGFSQEDLVEKFEQHAITVDHALQLTDGVKAELKKYIKEKHTIAVIGGDGTISSVAGMVAGTEAVLMPLPGGTLNHFTKDLGVDQDLDVALEHAVKSKPRRVDVARVNGMAFINNSSIGLYPFAVHVCSHFEDKLGKWPAALIASIRALLRYRLYDVTIGSETIKTPFIFIGNNDYHLENLESIGRRSLTAATLSVSILEAHTVWQLACTLIRFLLGGMRNAPAVRLLKTERLVIRSKRKTIRVARDGEVEKLSTPLEYAIEPAVLKVIGN